VLELAEPAAREAGVSFRRELSSQPPLVRADRLLIEQAAFKLVRNAVEAVQELSLRPGTREVEMLEEFFAAFGRMPRCNQDAA
jgi:C4-dicarboxylate-specific signal transduction histidine kinase